MGVNRRLYDSDMRGEYHVVSKADWERWLASELARLNRE
jgi:hypothetical protein